MTFGQIRRRERWVALLLVAILLVPGGLVLSRIKRDEQRVTLLRWLEDQAGIERGDWTDPNRTPVEASFYREVVRAGDEVDPDFESLDITGKWKVLRRPEMRPVQESFAKLIKEGNVHIQGVEIDLANTEVSANIGAVLLGFRVAVADVLWLQVEAAWHSGLVNRMLPLMKTVVKLDPQFLEAYSLGAWHLAYNITSIKNDAAWKRMHIDEAIDYLEGGLRKNPRSSQLYEDLGFTIYFRKLEDWEQAAYYLQQGIQYEPHEPRMEREAALSLERLRKEKEALALLEDFDDRHPTWTMHKLSIARLKRKLEARRLEQEGHLREALAMWKDLDPGAKAEPVAPMEVIRLRTLINMRDLEAKGDLEGARAEVYRGRSLLPPMYHEELDAQLRRLGKLIGDSAGAA